jgi:hypothetical protein
LGTIRPLFLSSAQPPLTGPVKDMITFIQLAMKMQPSYYITTQEDRIYRQILASQAKNRPDKVESVSDDESGFLYNE